MILSRILWSIAPAFGLLALSAVASAQTPGRLPDAPSALQSTLQNSMTGDSKAGPHADDQIAQVTDPSTPTAPATGDQNSTPSTPQPQPSTPAVPSKREQAADQMKQEEKQRALGVVPIFNVTYLGEKTVPLSAGQKFDLAFHSSIDPFVFFAAGVDAAYSQATNAFPGYGQGWAGYGKRLGASYADTVDGTFLGNALLPSLLHQDPRYYRMGKGTFTHRLLYSITTTVRCKDDNGKWAPNYSNVLGNLAAGGISNLYYPSTDRGAGLTIERGLTVTAEGTLGGVFDEFWPDISNKLFKKHLTGLQQKVPASTPAQEPAPLPAH